MVLSFLILGIVFVLAGVILISLNNNKKVLNAMIYFSQWRHKTQYTIWHRIRILAMGVILLVVGIFLIASSARGVL